jgi:hypothetical protein
VAAIEEVIRVRMLIGRGLVVGAVLLGALFVGGAVDDARTNQSSQALSSGVPRSVPPPRVDPFLLPRPSQVPIRTERPGWRASTAAEVAAGVRGDSFALDYVVGETTFGVPVFVRSVDPAEANYWLIPLVRGTETVGLLAARVRSDGTATAGVWQEWQGLFPHKISIPDAISRGSAPGDPVVATELVWALVLPMSPGSGGGIGMKTYPFYRLVRQSGAEFFLFQNDVLVPSKDVVLGN